MQDRKNTLQPWLVCFSAALFFCYLVFQLAIFNTVSSALMRDFSIQSTTLSKISAIYLYMASIFFLPAGLFFDRFSTKKILIIACILCILGITITATASSLIFVIIGRILAGISNPFSFLGAMRLSSRWFPPKRAAFVIGLIVTIGMSGGILAQAPFELLINVVGGWRNAMLINAICGLIIMLFIVLFVKDNPKNIPQIEPKISTLKLSFLQSLWQACKNHQNWLCGLYAGLVNLPLPILGALWGNLYLIQSKGYSSVLAGNMISLIFLGLIIGPSIMGWISDKINLRKSLMIISAGLIFLISIAIIYLPMSILFLGFLLFALGFMSGAQAMSYPIVIESNSREIESSALGFVSVIVNVIGAASQIFFAWLINLHWNGITENNIPLYTQENFKFALFLLPISFLISFLVAFLIQRTRSFEQSESMILLSQ